ncbi:ATP-binding protein [Bacteroidota bacterium]
MIKRDLYSKVLEYQQIFPVVAILGPRQCGKSTLAKMLISGDSSFVYLDLERYSDLNKINDPELFFRNNQDKNICIDEVQLKPNLFNSLRSVIDEDRKNGKFLILGSASRELIQQSSETLAGRIGYIELTPFNTKELENNLNFDLYRHWLRGGFPDSYLQHSNNASVIWRENFIRTFVERDVPQLGINIPSLTTRRLLSMCAHNQGQLLNSSKLGESLGTSYHTVKNYLDLLEQLFIVRSLKPYLTNINKRIIKSPKVFIRDSGILHSLMNIEKMNDLLGHPVFGSSWEGYCIENIVTQFYDWQSYFYRTSSGNEIDLILEKGSKKLAIEFKASTAPKLTKGIYQALDDLGIEKIWVIAPTDDSYALNERIYISTLSNFLQQTNKYS